MRQQPTSIRHLLLGLTFGLFASMPLLAQSPVHAGAATVSVGGLVDHPMTLDAAALARLPHVTVQAQAHDVSGSWSGVPLNVILAAAGAPTGKALRGKNMSLYVRIGAADHYHVVYALAELDPGFRNDPVILADRHDGKPLDAKEGPFRVVAPGELRPARWVREVTQIDVMRAPDGT